MQSKGKVMNAGVHQLIWCCSSDVQGRTSKTSFAITDVHNTTDNRI